MAEKKKKSNHSITFLEKKELIELEKDLFKFKHSLKIEELAYIRETERLKHEWELERGRIKTAEIRKSQERMGRMYRK